MNKTGIPSIAMLLVACASTRTKMASEQKPASPPVDPGDLEMEDRLFQASMVDGYEFAAGIPSQLQGARPLGRLPFT